MTIERNARFSALLNIILTSVEIIQDEYKNDISKNSRDSYENLQHDIVRIMDWNGSDLTKEHKIHDVGFYFIGVNDGVYPESKIANAKGIKFDKCFNDFLKEVQNIIISMDNERS